MENSKPTEVQDNPKSRSIYDAGSFEIFWKNFIAGVAKTLGSIFIYIVFMIIMAILFINFALPKFAPLIQKLNSLITSVEKIQQLNFPTGINLPNNFPSNMFQNK
jgi:hypothetical protein